MFPDPNAPFRPFSDRPGPADAWRRWEGAEIPRRERERFENDTLAQRKAPAARPPWYARLFRRPS